MGQLVLFFALQLLGSWMCLAAGPKQVGLAIAAGFLIGLAVTVFLCLPVLLAGQFTNPSIVAVISLSLAASVWLAVRRGRATPAIALQLLVGALAFTALCTPCCAWNFATQTYDSEQFIAYAQLLRAEEQLSFTTLEGLHSWGAFTVVAHALAELTGDDYLYALSPAFSISLFAVFGVTLHRGLAELSSRARVIAVVVGMLVLLAIPLVRIHVFYIHANWPAGGYLFVFSVLFWLADRDSDASYLPFAFLALLAFSLCRVESPMFAALFLVLALSQTQLARRALLPSYLAFTLVVVGWLLLMAAATPADSEYLTPTRSLLMAAALAGLFVLFVLQTFVRRLLPVVPIVVTVLCVLGVVAIAVTRSEAFAVSFPIWQRDLWTGSYWGYLWWPSCVVLTVLAFWVPAPPRTRWLRYAIALFFVLVALLAGLADFYSEGRYAGLTRLTLHIVPLVAYYFALTFAPWVARRAAPSDDRHHAPTRNRANRLDVSER